MEKLQQNIIIFDLDGTLTDSAEGVIRSAQHMQEKMGISKWADEDLKFIVGPPLIKTFTEDFQMNQEDAQRALGFFRERYATVGLFENKVYDGIPEMLEELKKKGKCLVVATSKKEETAVRILKHFEIDGYFDIIGGDNREIGRDTKAKVIEYVLESLGAKKEDAIMVGDRKFDVEGAHLVGIPCIAVEFGYGDRAEFEAYGADYIAETPKAVEELF
ncbi:HAD-IA family hydrolase [Anaerotignum propionicum]|jgi:phosphoglycolate phosphatase|uniref:5'-nucleotidase n=1 Tax=Anaerotignum propionicum DSM 1682 TaxID=991789 RepID=A0A120MKJ3_ANAPI|nr:HAD-IA family hydrolase [Anaerotignum propionicum]AMJ42473.1 5'-nucleotidase [Anaerotignum propionicum DSM 1682]MEA5056702.1 HAD-IA family hydrolase [Anaerotignum propionicum]SHE33700.1 phosphoglycolate phosphatase [[Clostridium] propionicum DSM 1682] [Anaerotignum propionicum DSM 1682]